MRHNTLDLFLVTLLTLVAVVAVSYGAPGLLRVALTLPLLFVFPGYAVVAALFPERDLDGAARLLMVLAVSLALAAAGGLVLHFSGAGLRSGSWAALLGGVVLGGSVIAFIRRTRQPAPTAPMTRIGIRVGQAALVGAGLILVLASVGVAREGVLGREYDGFTQLWAVPLPAPPGAAQTVQIGLRNEEGEPVRYRVVVLEASSVLVAWDEISVASGEAWQTIYTLPDDAGSDDKLDIHLYRLDAPERVYRRVSTVLIAAETQIGVQS